MTLDEITAAMSERVAAKGGIKGKAVKFDFGPDGCVRIDATGDPAVVDNADTTADCTIKISKSDFVDMSTGKLDSMSAFMTGKLKVEGDMGIAMQLGSILG
jgi:putative sterol carrier protein